MSQPAQISANSDTSSVTIPVEVTRLNGEKEILWIPVNFSDKASTIIEFIKRKYKTPANNDYTLLNEHRVMNLSDSSFQYAIGDNKVYVSAVEYVNNKKLAAMMIRGRFSPS